MELSEALLLQPACLGDNHEGYWQTSWRHILEGSSFLWMFKEISEHFRGLQRLMSQIIWGHFYLNTFVEKPEQVPSLSYSDSWSLRMDWHAHDRIIGILRQAMASFPFTDTCKSRVFCIASASSLFCSEY
jgi:hypothetical protein